MVNSARIRFFNFFRNVFKIPVLEKLLVLFTNGKGYDNFFVKCIPQNYQYKKHSFRLAKRNHITFRLDISEYMEWVIYFGLNVEEREGLYPLVKKDDTIMDIGTNIGETLLNFAYLTGPGGMVYGFEPVHENFIKCQANIGLNKFTNIQVKQVAISDKHELLYFGSAENRNSGGIFMNKEKKESNIPVQALTLDEFTNGLALTKIDLVKIDVEGFEYNVLLGAQNTIRKYRPVLFVEVDEVNLQRQGSSANGIIEYIRSIGYRVKKPDGGPVNEINQRHFDIICEPVNK